MTAEVTGRITSLRFTYVTGDEEGGELEITRHELREVCVALGPDRLEEFLAELACAAYWCRQRRAPTLRHLRRVK